MKQPENRTWMIRYVDNSFSRPMSENELKQKFNLGEMVPQDEICSGDGYWFSLQDVNEMRIHFGNMPMEGLFKKVNEERTQERYAVTAPIVVPPVVKAALKQAPIIHSDAKIEESIQKTPPLMKALLILLTLVVVILLFVWFG